MKNIIYILLLALSMPIVALATPVSWDYSSNVLKPLQSLWEKEVQVPYITATSTTATSTFPIASSTTICLSGDCQSSWPSGGSGIATTSIDTEAELEAILTDVTDLFTSNDGSLADDDLSDNDSDDLTEGGSNLYFTNERAQDQAGSMFTGNTETRIVATYQDGDGTIDLVVDGSLSNYTNDAGFLTTVDISDNTNLTVSATGLSLTNDVVALTAGYTIPLTASTSQWATAFGWGDHSTEGYLTTVDISENTNLAGDTEIVLTGDTLSIASTIARDSELHNAVTLAGEDFLSLSTQQITANAINPDNLASADFGDFTCNGTTCSLDATYLQNVVEDTTPQLGGDLDAQSNDILSVGALAIGSSTANKLIDVIGDAAGGIAQFTRTPSSATNAAYGTFNIKAVHDSNMGDSFGAALQFLIQDSTSDEEVIADIRGQRDGADDSGLLRFVTFAAGVAGEAFTLAADKTATFFGDIIGANGGWIRDEVEIYSFSMASSTDEYVANLVEAPSKQDAFVATGVMCYVVGGTSIGVNLSDGTNDTNVITCDTTRDTTPVTISSNGTFTAGETVNFELSSKTGSPDKVVVTVIGYFTN